MEAALEGGLSCWQVACDGATVRKHDRSGAEAFGHLVQGSGISWAQCL